jgi:adenylyl-sulfate kinase
MMRRSLASEAVVHADTGPGPSGLTIWLTGLSSSGKTTLARIVHDRLRSLGYRVILLDGDEIRRHLCSDLGFSKQDRDENVRRVGYVAELLAGTGVIVLVSLISPYRAAREEQRSRMKRFVEVYVNAPLAVCEERDVKGLYNKARAGQLRGFTGIDDPYEPPLHPQVECRTDRETVAESADKIMRHVEAQLTSME